MIRLATTLGGLSLVALFTLHGLASLKSVKASGDLAPILRRASDTHNADRPSGPATFIVVSSKNASSSMLGSPTGEVSTPPAEPTSPGSEGKDAPSFFGETLRGSFVLILDISDSMMRSDTGVSVIEDWAGNVITSPSRLDRVKSEAIRALQNLDENSSFDIVYLAGCDVAPHITPPITNKWRGQLVQASQVNVDAATQSVMAAKTRWGTPTNTAVRDSCQHYGANLNKIILLTDGAPTMYDIPGWSRSMTIDERREWACSNILNAFPGWFEKLRNGGCTLSCIHIGSPGPTQDFLISLAALGGGSYSSH